jgi:hypothetical protein
MHDFPLNSNAALNMHVTAYMRTVLLASMALTSAASATPSGLNNIPTADTTPPRTLVFQGFSTMGGESDTDFNLGADEIWLRKGHIPGAVSFHWARLIEKDNTHKFKPFAEVKADLEAAGITPDKEILCYCGTSREGSLLRFYLKHVAGYPKVRLYEGAWKEYVWLKGKSLPAETTESTAKK